MFDISVRELRNNTSDVLQRVEQGEEARITVSRRPVAQLAPLPRKQSWTSAAEAWRLLKGAQADPQLRGELDELLPQTTDQISS